MKKEKFTRAQPNFTECSLPLIVASRMEREISSFTSNTICPSGPAQEHPLLAYQFDIFVF